MLSLLLILYRLPVLLWVLKVLMTFGTVLGSALCLLYSYMLCLLTFMFVTSYAFILPYRLLL